MDNTQYIAFAIAMGWCQNVLRLCLSISSFEANSSKLLLFLHPWIVLHQSLSYCIRDLFHYHISSWKCFSVMLNGYESPSRFCALCALLLLCNASSCWSYPTNQFQLLAKCSWCFVLHHCCFLENHCLYPKFFLLHVFRYIMFCTVYRYQYIHKDSRS